MMWKKFVSHEIVLLKLLKKSARSKEQDKRRAKSKQGDDSGGVVGSNANLLKWVTEWADTQRFLKFNAIYVGRYISTSKYNIT